MAQEFNAAVTFPHARAPKGDCPRPASGPVPPPVRQPPRPDGASRPAWWTQCGCPHRTTPTGGSGVSGGPPGSIRTVNPSRSNSASASAKDTASSARTRRFPSIFRRIARTGRRMHAPLPHFVQVHCGLPGHRGSRCSREHQEGAAEAAGFPATTAGIIRAATIGTPIGGDDRNFPSSR